MDNVKKIQEMYAAFLRGDMPTVLANLTEDATWGTETQITEVPWYPVRSGREGIAEYFATMARETEFEQFDPYLFLGDGDDVVVCTNITYRLRKNGKVVPTGSLHRIKMRDGLLTSFRAFEDTASVRDAWVS
jgi:ketosteroid isomerase-like protein